MKRALWIGALCSLAGGAIGGCNGELPVEPAVVTDPMLPQGESPPPVSGGSMIITRDGDYAVVADSHANSVFFVSIAKAGWELAATVPLQEGDEPGRVLEGRDGEILVALRRGGAIVTISEASLSEGEREVTRTPVCPAPRGMAFDADRGELHVACAGGELVTLVDGAVVRELRLEPDLRDVVVVGGRIYVSQFRSAKVFALDAADASGAIAATGQPQHYTSPLLLRQFDGAVGWRMRALPNGDIIMLHQHALSEEIPTGAPVVPGASYYGGNCDETIVHAAVTVFDPGTLSSITPPDRGAVGNLVLPVDMAIHPDGQQVAFVGAGNDAVVQLPLSKVELGDVFDDCFGTPPGVWKVAGEPLSVGYTPGGGLVVHTRQPATVMLFDATTGVVLQSVTLPVTGGRDVGHALFHKAAAEFSPIACASCHPEGRDDGRVWQFANIGGRRTQSLSMGVLETLPLHWDGDLPTMHDLVHEVFVNRMGGVEQPEDRVDSLGTWLDQLHPLPPSQPLDSDAVARGNALFHDATVGCAGCHAGERLTTNATVGVGTGKLFQVPSLIDVRQRAPFMHDGCAETLRQRFDDVACGGNEHGNTSALTSDQIDDLVTYLETL